MLASAKPVSSCSYESLVSLGASSLSFNQVVTLCEGLKLEGKKQEKANRLTLPKLVELQRKINMRFFLFFTLMPCRRSDMSFYFICKSERLTRKIKAHSRRYSVRDSKALRGFCCFCHIDLRKLSTHYSLIMLPCSGPLLLAMSHHFLTLEV